MKMLKSAVALSLVGGYVLGKAGNALFGGDAAKQAYTAVATGAVIAKDSVMERVEKIQAGAADIAEDAKNNAERYYAKKDAAYDRGVDPAEEAFEEAAEVVAEAVEEAGEEA